MSLNFKSDSGVFNYLSSDEIIIDGKLPFLIGNPITIGSHPVPEHYSSAGISGQIAYDKDTLYICVENNNWMSVELNNMPGDPVSSQLSSSVSADEDLMTLLSYEGFNETDIIGISVGTEFEEYNEIKNLNPFTLEYPLVFDHDQGNYITKSYRFNATAPSWTSASEEIDFFIGSSLIISYDKSINFGGMPTTFSLIGVNKDIFTIGSNRQLSFIDNDSISAGETYQVSIVAENEKGASIKSLNVKVISVAPTWSSETDYVNVAEGTAKVSLNETLSAGDNEITYTIDSSAADIFNVDACNGKISFKEVPDFEIGPTQYIIILTATNDSGSDSITITVNVTDVIEYYNLYLIGENGNPVSDEVSYVNGELVTVAPGSDPGYNFISWSSDQVVVNNENQFVMPTNDVTITANYTAINYTVTVDGTIIGTTYNVGQQVSLTSPTPNEGYSFDGWSSPQVNIADNAFTMPADNVTITANYTAIDYTVTVNGINGAQSASAPGGNFNVGETVTLIATPDSGYEFDNWTFDSEVKKIPNNDWSKVGNNIDEGAWSVAVDSHGSIIAIGTKLGNDDHTGRVRVYQRDAGTPLGWVQIGNDIYGEASQDYLGSSVALSSDGSIVAIGAPYNDGNGTNSGHVRVYERNADVALGWAQIGNDIDGKSSYNYGGWSVALSSDGSIVAIGAYHNNDVGTDAGHVRVYERDDSVPLGWTQIGGDINAEAPQDYSAYSIDISSDGSIVAIGAPYNDGSGTNSGHVRVYERNADVALGWAQIGNDIDGEAGSDHSGRSVALSSDGSIVAIGADDNDNIDTDVGHVRVYERDDSAPLGWTQIGSDIDGESRMDNSGHSVAISSDGSIVAIGAPDNDGVDSNAGHVRIYQRDDSATLGWTQIGSDIDGESRNGYFGRSVALSSDGLTVVIGANGVGHAEIFRDNINSFIMPARNVTVTANYLISQ